MDLKSKKMHSYFFVKIIFSFGESMKTIIHLGKIREKEEEVQENL